MNRYRSSIMGIIMVMLCLPVLLKVLPIGYEAVSLSGMHADAPKPALSVAAFTSGVYQKEATAYFNQNFALRGEYVRLTNQLYYDLFKKSYMYKDTLLIGKNRYVYEKYYLDDYTEERVATTELQALVRDLELVQKRFEQYGKPFVLVITPSKARTLPDFVPTAYRKFMDNDNLPYNQFVALLQESQLNFVDGQQITNDARCSSERILFTKGGTHWNSYCVSLTLNEVFKNLNARYSMSIPLIEPAELRVDRKPVGLDTDIYDLLNIMDKPSYEALHTVWKPVAGTQDKLSIGLIGGSFSWGMIDVLDENVLLGPSDVYFYYRLGHAHFENHQREERKIVTELSAEQWQEEFLSHDIIILELNSSMPIAPVQEFLAAAKKFL